MPLSPADTPGPSQVNKSQAGPELEAAVQRIFYLRHGRGGGRQQDQEVFPDPNPALLAELEACDAVLYGMGSLYTSICPSLILQVNPPPSASMSQLPSNYSISQSINQSSNPSTNHSINQILL